MRLVSQRLSQLPVSAPMRVDMRAKELVKSGRDVVSFCVGEPDFPIPLAAAEAGIASISRGVGYTNAAGTAELRQAVADALLRDHGLSYTPAQVAVTTGAKYAVYAAVMALTDPGTEVILPAPYWTSYASCIRLAGAVPVVVRCTAENGWRLTPDALAAAVTERTRALILNNPNNPSGAVYARAELSALADVCQSADIAVIADEVYAALTYEDEPFCAAAAVSADMFARTVTVNGVSKRYAMTGWRIGCLASPDEALMRGVTAFLSHTTGCPSAVSQAAATAALSGPQDGVLRMRDTFLHRRDVMDAALTRAGILHTVPQGAFYMMADVRPAMGAFATDAEFALAAVDRAGVAATPLSAFGLDGFLRLSFTLDDRRIEEGVRRLAAFLAAQKGASV